MHDHVQNRHIGEHRHLKIVEPGAHIALGVETKYLNVQMINHCSSLNYNEPSPGNLDLFYIHRV